MFKALMDHPQVFVPIGKEIYFFNEHYNRGLGWYAKFFEGATQQQGVVGELTPNYLFFEEVARRIKEDLPNVKLFACVRNPIERSLSACNMRMRNSFHEQDVFATLQEHPYLLERSRYFKFLKMYFDIFGHERFKVFVFDDLKQDATQFAQSIYEFIEVDSEHIYANANKSILEASIPRNRLLSALTFGMFMRTRKKMGWLNFIGKIRNTPIIMKLLYKPIDEAHKKEQLNEDQINYLKDYFREDIEKLEVLLNRNFQHWLE